MLPEQTAQLRAAVLKTLAYFDLNAFPLTLLELRRNLYFDEPAEAPPAVSPLQLEDFIAQDAILRKLVQQQNGFYYLAGSGANIRERQRRHYLKLNKWRRALVIARWLRYVPFLEMIAVCNTVAGGVARPPSDIDFFLIAQPGRIWTVRLGALFLTALAGRRRGHKKIQNRACLSFIITNKTTTLNLAPLALRPADPYLAYWITQVSPLWGLGVYTSFWQNNKTLRKNLPYATAVCLGPRFRLAAQHRPPLRVFLEKILKGRLGTGLEKILGRAQKRRILHSQNKKKPDPRANVIVSDALLKFHEIDRRREYAAKLTKKLAELNHTLS